MKFFLLILLTLPSILAAELHKITITNFEFTPNDIDIKVGDTVRWENHEGFHGVSEDATQAFDSGAPTILPFTLNHTFETAGEVFFHCSAHSSPGKNIDRFPNGRINVVSDTAEEPEFLINQGISGSWYFPDTSGSGLMIDIRPSDKLIFAAWFTYDEETVEKLGATENNWYTAIGNYEKGLANEMKLYYTSGGIFDNPQDVTTEQVGTFTLDFTDCNTGTVYYSFINSELMGSFPIQRAVPGTEGLCEDIASIETP